MSDHDQEGIYRVVRTNTTRKQTGYILAIARGHNGGACLLKDGKIVFSIEEERLSRRKYDGGPFAAMVKTLDYTNRIDALVIAHTQSLIETAATVDYAGDDVYSGMARKLGLIDPKLESGYKTTHPQVYDLSGIHHKLHASCAFYRSGFDKAVAVIADGAGTFYPLNNEKQAIVGYEVESIFTCEYPSSINTIYKHMGTTDIKTFYQGPIMLEDPLTGQESLEVLISDRAGITKTYEAVTDYCGFAEIEAGKTMGLFPYGKPNDNIPPLYEQYGENRLSSRSMFVPNYPNGAFVNNGLYSALQSFDDDPDVIQNVNHMRPDLTKLQNRRDMAYAVQTQSQEEMVNIIRKAVDSTGCNNVVISGGYGLNCVANYHYLEALKDQDINIYVEPVSNDAGTAMGAALYYHHHITQSMEKTPQTLYLGPAYCYNQEDIDSLATEYDATVSDASQEDIIDLLEKREIVSIFQGRCENGPRALGNRSILYDPRDPDGKDHVNEIKRREYFRPFAGTILAEDVHDWFDLRGMQDSPHMMYAVNCQQGVEEKIPAIIHVDGTCRIQTVTEEENPNYYNLIKAWKERTGVPVIFNTSFNLGGEPLVETLEDALWTLQQSDIEYLYLPEYGKLITTKN
jgi:carbamoyltransferase